MKWFTGPAPVGYSAPHHSWFGNLWSAIGASLSRTAPSEEFRAEVELATGFTVRVDLASGLTDEVGLATGFTKKVEI